MSTSCRLFPFFSLVFSAIFGLSLIGCSGSGSNESRVVVKGSDTMVHLVSHWAESFRNENPENLVVVTGGGSGTGVAALLNQTTDICMSSRDLKEEEREAAAGRGFAMEEFAVAMDGLAIAVHVSNPIEALTMAQLKAIFTGAVSNWSEVGGQDRAIQVLSRESSSGTYVFFQEFVLEKENFASNAKLMPATASIVQTLQSDDGSIGYIGLGYAEDAGDSIKVIPIKADDASEPVDANIETVQSGAYPIARPLYFITAGAPSDLARSFIDFALGAAGQKIVEESGYVPVTN